jgi:uncharacterized protein
MEPQVRRWSSVDAFLSVAGEFLVAREAEHCLLLGLASTIANHPEVYPEARFWTVHEDGRVVAVALWTPPHNLILSQIDEARWLAALAEEVLANEEVPGVHGSTDAARGFADAWSARTGGTVVRVLQERIFRLDQVIAPRAVPGQWREAEERDRAVLAAWSVAFAVEALPDGPPPDGAEAADRMLRRVGRVAYVWEDAGEVVALAAAGGPTPRGIRLGPVYTPPAQRGRGYASNLVAAVSQGQLDAGRSFCFLFTDVTNPTSNRIYQAIGYEAVTNVEQYRFVR